MTQRESADVVEANDRAASSETGRHTAKALSRRAAAPEPPARVELGTCARR